MERILVSENLSATDSVQQIGNKQLSRRRILVLAGAVILGSCSKNIDKKTSKTSPTGPTSTTVVHPATTTSTAPPTPSTSAANAQPISTRQLHRTNPIMEGPDVQILQKDLNILKCGEASPVHQPLNPDSQFGPKVEAAVEQFQKGHNLDADGWAGPLTQKAIVTSVNNGETSC